jgi:hypothetical protein
MARKSPTESKGEFRRNSSMAANLAATLFSTVCAGARKRGCWCEKVEAESGGVKVAGWGVHVDWSALYDEDMASGAGMVGLGSSSGLRVYERAILPRMRAGFGEGSIKYEYVHAEMSCWQERTSRDRENTSLAKTR